VDDYVAEAEKWIRKAVLLGDADAKLSLANMYRLGDLGRVDMEEYHRLLDEAMKGGSQLAEMRFCKDIAYGVEQEADIDKGLALAREKLASHQNPDPRWYDTIGWMLFSKDEKEEANQYFLKSIENGYVDSYMGLTDMPEKVEEGRKAGCGGCCISMAETLKEKYDECGRNDANAVEYFSDDNEKRAYLDANYNYRKELAAQIEALYEEAIRLGESLGLYYLGMIYHDALFGHFEDDDKAWEYFMRGNKLSDVSCISMLSNMIMEGRAPEEYQYEDACFYSLRALRYGDDDQLLTVMEGYFDGCLDEYKEEIELLYKPRYDELEDDVCMNPGRDYEDDDPEDDDGRFDAWA